MIDVSKARLICLGACGVNFDSFREVKAMMKLVLLNWTAFTDLWPRRKASVGLAASHFVRDKPKEISAHETN